MPSSLSSRRLTDSFCKHVVHGEVLARVAQKRRAGRYVPQPVGIVDDPRRIPGASKSRNRSKAARECRATFSSRSARATAARRSCDLPLGSPIIPVPPPTMAIGECAEALQPRQRHHGQQVTDVQARGRRIEPDVRGQRLRAPAARQRPRSRRTPARATAIRRRRSPLREGDLLYQSMAIQSTIAGRATAEGVRRRRRQSGLRRASARRGRCIGSSTPSVAARAHAGDAAGRRSARRTGRPADRPDHRRPSKPLGLRTKTSSERSAPQCPRDPDLIVLGGDYVTWGIAGTSARSAEALAASPRHMAFRHSRQSR